MLLYFPFGLGSFVGLVYCHGGILLGGKLVREERNTDEELWP